MAIVWFALVGAIWRRWFGGGFKKFLPDSRFWKYTVLIVVCFTMYYAKTLCFTFLKEITTWLTIAAFMCHWARSHGDYFYVYDTSKDEGRIKWIDWVLRTIYGEGQYYNVKGNVTGLFLRYTGTACLVALSIPDAWFVCAGLFTTLSYVITGKTARPTDKAEWIAGALNFGLLYLCL